MTKRVSSSLSAEEVSFLNLEVSIGEFETFSEALRHYARRGLQAEAKFEDALAI